MQDRIVVVCGYGCNLDSPLKPYLNRVVRFCRETRPDVMILCGGKTQRKSFPGLTEASVMYDYLWNELDSLEDWHPAWFTEDDSYTTYENVRDSSLVIGNLRMNKLSLGQANGHEEITFFCEASRALKVKILTRHFLGFPPLWGGPDIRIETDSWERMNPLKELMDTISATTAIRLPILNTIKRRRQIAKSYTR